MSISTTMKTWAKRIKRDGVTLWFAGKHPLTPWYAKSLGLFVVAYALSPIDLIPDFIPVLGYLDDLILVPLYITLAVRWIPTPILADARARADQSLSGEKPTRWFYVLPVVIIWLILLAVLGKVVRSRLAIRGGGACSGLR